MKLSEKYNTESKQNSPTNTSEQQNSLDDLRATNKIQARPSFFDEKPVDQPSDFYQQEVTEEFRQDITYKLTKLGNIFANSDINWQLDGAINISLAKQDFIRQHKDIDLTIDPEDLEKLEKQLFDNGYALFLSQPHPNPKKKQMLWATTQEFQQAPQDQLMIAAINPDGTLNSSEKLNYIDVHLIHRNQNHQPLSFTGTPLPDEWYQPQPIKFNDTIINLSHPAKTTYFKLHSDRPFDQIDLEKFAHTDQLSADDLKKVATILETEHQQNLKTINYIITDIAPAISLSQDSESILSIMQKNPTISQMTKSPQAQIMLKKLATQLADLPKRDPGAIKDIIMNFINPETSYQNRKNRLQKISKLIK